MSGYESPSVSHPPAGYRFGAGSRPFITVDQREVADYTGYVIAVELAGLLETLVADAVAQVVAALREPATADPTDTPPPTA